MYVCRLSVCLSVTRWYCVKTTQARITKSSPTDRTRTLVFGIKIHPKIWKGWPQARALNGSGVGKIRNFQPISRRIPETVQDRTKVMTNTKPHTPFRLVPKSTTGWPWTADKHSVAEKMRLSEHTTKISMKTDPYCQQQKCRPMTVVSGGIRFMRICAEVPRGGGAKRQWDCRQRQFSAFSLAIFSDTLEMRPALLYGHMQSVVGFSATLKCMTLNDLHWLFRVKFCFRAGFGRLRK